MQQSNVINVDFGAIEERVIANRVSGDSQGRVYVEGELVYSSSFTLEALYERLTGKRPERPFTPEERKAIKAINFGEMYGMSKSNMAKFLASKRYAKA